MKILLARTLTVSSFFGGVQKECDLASMESAAEEWQRDWGGGEIGILNGRIGRRQGQ